MTDAQLNRLFDEKVAARRLRWLLPVPDYTADINLVMPFLEKSEWSGGRMHGSSKTSVHVYNPSLQSTYDASFPRAAVIALLQAHGVLVTSTT